MLHFIKFTYSSDPYILFNCFRLASSVVRKPENCIHYILILDSTGHLKWGLLQSRVMMLLSPILIEPKLLCVAKAALTLAKVSKGWFHRHRCQRCPMSELGRNWVGTGSVETGSELGRNWVGTGSELGRNWFGRNWVRIGSELGRNGVGTGSLFPALHCFF